MGKHHTRNTMMELQVKQSPALALKHYFVIQAAI